MKKTNLAFGAVTVLVIGLAVWWEFGRLTSPGPLHPTHARVKELSGRNDCRVCHGGDSVTMTDACLACHEPIAAQLTSREGLHGRLDPGEAVACQRCHAEHHGGEVPLISEVSFGLSGIATPSQYRHEDVPDFALIGAHNQVGCVACHVLAEQPRLAKGERRFLGLEQSCTACHEDVHQGAFSTDCASCHGQSDPFDVVAAFEHTRDFTLTGSHSGLACLACHEKGGAFSIEAEQARESNPVRSCSACHESEHTAGFLEGVAEALGTDPLETCAECHAVEDAGFRFPEAGLSDELHAFTGFVLESPHDSAECLQCHTPPGTITPKAETPIDAGASVAWVTLSRTPDDCRACHGDPHEGQFDVAIDGDVTQPSCLECHDRHGFTPSTFDEARHARTAFPLDEAHATVACVECHEPMEAVATVFAGTPTACAACHEDTHAGQFMAQLENDCSICHTTARFAPSLFDELLHAETRFELDGGHLAVGCRDCHEVVGETRRFVDTPMACAACHEDVHEGAFDGPDLPAAVDGATGCARCHTTESFDVVTWAGDTHERWTGYALVGKHSEATCNACHKPDLTADTRVYSFAKAPTDCSSCHQDPHAAQFDQGGFTDCARCHNADQTFTQLSFDHQTDSEFKLDETHSVLSCAECHRPDPASPTGIVRFRPIAHECSDCHGFGELEP